MLQLSLEHSDVDQNNNQDKISSYSERIKQVRGTGTYDQPECSLKLPDDQTLLSNVNDLVKQKVTESLKYSIVIGIGGSNLGTKAIYDARFGYRDLMEPERFPKMLFAETTDPEWLTALTALLRTIKSVDEVLITVASKSGGTTETLANFEIVMQVLKTAFGDVRERVVVITDDDSNFMQAAQKQNISCLAMPKLVGGRYSVLSAVGLFPLASVGIDIEQLRKGASELLDHCLQENNMAAASANTLFIQSGQGKTINDNFFFHPELESLGKWYRQLMGESVGKERSLDDQIVHAGITPTVSLGSTDLHSVGQLYLGGPKDKLTTFVASAKSEELKVPSDRVFSNLVPMITNKSASQIMHAILEGVKIAYRHAELPFMEITLDALDEHSLGSFLQFKMLEMMYLGVLLNVNSFDQPNVESYKIETKRLLSE